MFKFAVPLLLIFCSSAFTDTLTLGWDIWNPYHTVDSKGKHIGSDIEILQTVFDSMHTPLRFEKSEWDNEFKMLKAGRIDLMRGAGYTKERASYAYYSLPYRHESFSLFIEKSPEYMHLSDVQLFDLFKAGKLKLTLNRGYFYGSETDSILKSAYKPHTIQYLTTPNQLLTMAKTKRLSSFIIETASAGDLISEKSGFRRIELPEGGAIHLIFSKASVSEEVVKKYNAAFERVLKNGALLPIYKKYGITPPKQ